MKNVKIKTQVELELFIIALHRQMANKIHRGECVEVLIKDPVYESIPISWSGEDSLYSSSRLIEKGQMNIIF